MTARMPDLDPKVKRRNRIVFIILAAVAVLIYVSFLIGGIKRG